MAIGKYIYGIINSNHEKPSGPYGIVACKEVYPALSKESELNTTRKGGVYFIPYQDISAVVNDAEIVDYTHMFKDVLARLLVGHQKVIERIMSLEYTIIPMKLGTFALNEADVKDILAKGYGLIKEIVQKIDEKIEIDVVCTWSDFTSAVKDVGEEKEIREFKEKLLKYPQGITVDDQMKIGFMLRKALNERRESYTFRIQDALKTLCVDLKQHELMDDEMVSNMAFLIDKASQKEFYAKIEELNAEFKELLNFRCVGPLPAYSFFTLEIKKMQFTDVDWARKRLGILEDCTTKDNIKRAYQKQALFLHPDRNPDKPGIEREFDEIKRSYNMLLDFAQACEQAGRESLIFNEDEFKKNAVLVRLRE